MSAARNSAYLRGSISVCWRPVEADLIPELFAYALETLGPESIEDTWSELHDYEGPCAYDPESPRILATMPYSI